MDSETRTPNLLLRRERTIRGWSQQRVAQELDTTKEMVSKWECGTQTPSKHYQEKLCLLFGKSASELGFMQEEDNARSHAPSPQPFQDMTELQRMLAHAVTQGIIGAVHELGSLDLDELRRKILERAVELALGTAISHVPLLDMPSLATITVPTEELLLHCEASLKSCWYLLQGKGLFVTEEILASCIPSLRRLTFSPSPYQKRAAALAVQAHILQAIVSMHRLDLTARKLSCMEAVTCARIANDPSLLTAALMYLGYTYVYHSIPRQPGHAVVFFEEALTCLDNNQQLLIAALHCGLAAAYAQCGKKDEALDSLQQAETYFPASPESNQIFRYIDCGKAEFFLRVGKVYLDLAQHYPTQEYYALANEAFKESIALQAMADRSTSEILIHQGAAALGMGHLELYESHLRKGLVLAKEVGSQKRLIEAQSIAQRTPVTWQNNQRIQGLEEEFFLPLKRQGVN